MLPAITSRSPLRRIFAAALALLAPFAMHAQGPANPTVSNKETQIQRFYVIMGDASQGHDLGKTALSGGGGGTEFTDSLKDGGLLVGFDVWPGDKQLDGIQPIFQTVKGRVRGAKHGKCNGTPTTIEAKDDYAAAGVDANGGAMTSGFEVIFMKIYHSGMGLDAVATYKSPWVGGRGGKASRLVPNQKPIIGIYGATSDKGIVRLGMLYYDRK